MNQEERQGSVGLHQALSNYLSSSNGDLRFENDILRAENGHLRRENDDLRGRYQHSTQIVRDLVSVIERMRTAKEREEEHMYDFTEIEVAAKLATLSAGLPPGSRASIFAPLAEPEQAYLVQKEEQNATILQGNGVPPARHLSPPLGHLPSPASLGLLPGDAAAAASADVPMLTMDENDRRFNNWLNGVDEAPSSSALPAVVVKTEPTEATIVINDSMPSLAVSSSNTPLRSSGRKAKHPRVSADIPSGHPIKRRKITSIPGSSVSPRLASRPRSSPSTARQLRPRRRQEKSPVPLSLSPKGPFSRSMSLRATTRAQSYESELREAISELDLDSVFGEDGVVHAADAPGLSGATAKDEVSSAMEDDEQTEDEDADEMELDSTELENIGEQDEDFEPEESIADSESSESEASVEEEEPSVPVNSRRSLPPNPARSAASTASSGWTAINRPRQRGQASTSPLQPTHPRQVRPPKNKSVSSKGPATMDLSGASKPSQVMSNPTSRYATSRATKRRFAQGTVPGIRFEFFRKPRSVLEVWEEWHEGGAHGNLPLGQLENEYGSAWRSRPGDKAGMKYASNYVSVRRFIVDYVDRQVEERLGDGYGLRGAQKEHHEAAVKDAAKEFCVQLDERVKGRIMMLTDCLRKNKDPFTQDFGA